MTLDRWERDTVLAGKVRWNFVKSMILVCIGFEFDHSLAKP